MFFDWLNQPRAQATGPLAAIGRSQGVVECELDGTGVRANENFLALLGYGSHEIVGRHHGLQDAAEAVGAISQTVGTISGSIADVSRAVATTTEAACVPAR